MGLFHKLMDKLGRYRLIPDRTTGEDYLHRYYLFLKDRKYFPFNVTLHKIVRSDDPIFHDHPWSYMTVVLKGGYWEHTPVFNNEGLKIAEFQTWRGPGSIIKRSAGEYHWLELDESVGPATTLFFMGRQKREWGFLVQVKKGIHRWIKWTDYLDGWKPYHAKYIAKAANKKKD
jgi:hypothetical protein